MKHKHKIIIAVFAAVLLCLGGASFSYATKAPDPAKALNAQYFQADNIVKTQADKTAHSYFIAGNNVTLENQIDGILFAAGSNVDHSAKAEYSFMAGNAINFYGENSKDIFMAGNNISIKESAKLGRDLFAAGSTINIDAPIQGNAFLAAEQINLGKNAKINGNLEVSAEKINFADGSHINGALVYNDDASVLGLDKKNTAKYVATYASESKQVDKHLFKAFAQSLLGLGFLIKTFGLILIFIVLGALTPRSFKTLGDLKFKDFVISGLKGICGIILIPILVILLICSLIGIPLSVILLTLYIFTLFISSSLTAIWAIRTISTKLFKLKPNYYAEAIIGIFIMQVLILLPYVGATISVIAVCCGFGLAMHIFKCNHRPQLSKKNK